MDLFKTFSKRNFGFEELLGKDERKTSETFVSCGTNLFKERKTTQLKISRRIRRRFQWKLRCVSGLLHLPR
tara:strand:+ start:252 stop:464 length:213 start_codon:yes stop_codon:yes gene_type:complete